MKSIIKWQTGEPTEFGEYLTIRKSRINGSMSVNFNMWAKDEIMRHSPLPESCPQGWQIMSPDACDIVAWAKLSDIIVDEEINEDALQALQAKCIAEDIENGVMKKDMGHYYPNDEQSWIQGYAVGFYKGFKKAKGE